MPHSRKLPSDVAGIGRTQERRSSDRPLPNVTDNAYPLDKAERGSYSQLNSMTINCPHCHQEIAVEEDAAGRYACPLCAGSLLFERAAPIVPPPPAPSLPPQDKSVLCEKCSGPMIPAKIPRFSSGVRVLGRFFLWPGVLAVGIGIVVLAMCGMNRSWRQDLVWRSQATDKIEMRQAVAEVEFSEFLSSAGFVFFGSAAIVFGRILCGKRSVRKCTVCGFHYPTA